MSSEEIRPFLAGQYHDVLRQLVAGRNEAVQDRIAVTIARSIDTDSDKIDGKGGALDGTIAISVDAMYVPICGAYPGPKIEYPRKPFDTGKEAKDKEGKEGKEAKDIEESKGNKEGDKDSSDSGKFSGDEVQDPFLRLGERERLPWEDFNAIARAHPERLQMAIARGSLVL